MLTWRASHPSFARRISRARGRGGGLLLAAPPGLHGADRAHITHYQKMPALKTAAPSNVSVTLDREWHNKGGRGARERPPDSQPSHPGREARQLQAGCGNL
ncbi:hypothetical protein NDU88_001909 [Pleurodeles waltl]|uniref:Uncharacterized protein n=1 Tax=Pleurodeles waltl TaxID=8319 RepID=A0AAV7U9T0_PLEWA|nr:hypothetical protein NDU88_001909 [Pleurodeles waltl]